jgi:antitoxin component YwqK of YwqJK toxin-antitoxin module
MKFALTLIMICMIALTGCQKEVKQYHNGKLVYEGTVNQDGLPEGTGKLYDSKTGKLTFKGLFRNGIMFKGTQYDKNGENPHLYEE